jgi:S1-C subfamily serine protease
VAVLSGAIGVAVGAATQHSGSSTAKPTAVTEAPTTAPKAPQTIPSPSKRTPSTGGSNSSDSSSDGSTGASLSVDDIANAVDPAIVDIYSTVGNGEAAGTGMVLTSDGLVLTNNHVIADGTDIRAQVNGSGPSYKVDVLGYDTTADVALVQLENASNLKTINVGDSDAVQVGDDVVALGNALGKGGTPAVAPGTVTALDQSITVSDQSGQNAESLDGLIEINAALQPGDSGGPLVNASAEVIGMDTAASASFRRSSGADGYAIPINDALTIAHQIQSGKSSAEVHIGDRALLGVEIDGTSNSATVAAVQPNSPADDAGLTAGDTITAVDGNAVTDGASLRAALDPYHPGDNVTITWEDSNGQSHHADATLVVGPPA